MIPSSSLAACFLVFLFFFLQLCSARLKLSRVSLKVFDATVCSYLTWAPALCVCTINIMPHELHCWEGGGKAAEEDRRQAVSLGGFGEGGGGSELRYKSIS